MSYSRGSVTSPHLAERLAGICGNVSTSCVARLLSAANLSHHGGESEQDGAAETGGLDPKDASWIMTSALIIFTMQTGFGLLESGSVSPKSETNIMMKNALDVVFGGVTYWAVGFGFSFGQDAGTNPFIGVGNFFGVAAEENVGYTYALFLFQFSFATTSTTIVSGAMAERTKLLAYTCFSMLMTVIYAVPAHWVWAEQGFLYQLGAVDVAGCGPVHMVGGVTGLVATLMIGPRVGAFSDSGRGPLPSPMKAILGMFMLWWAWLRFNSGSVFIVSSKAEWSKAVRAAVNTIVSSIGGGICSVIISLIKGKLTDTIPYDIGLIINGILGSLVSVTAICTICEPWEAFAIGCIGVVICVVTDHVVYMCKIDDPVGVIPVHFMCGVWGLLAVGLFIPAKDSPIAGQAGLFKTGQPYLLGIQALTALLIIVWTCIMSMMFLKVIDLVIGLRLAREHEERGADYIEHGIKSFFTITDSELENHFSGEEDDVDGSRRHAMEQFQTLLKATSQGALTLEMSNPLPNVIRMELRLKEKNPSIDSGWDAKM